MLLLPLLLQLSFVGLLVFGSYWVIRLAVRHGVQDADKRRAASGPEE